MAELELESEVVLDEDGESIVVRNVRLSDSHGHSLLSGQEPGDRVETVRRALRLGLFALSRLALGGDVDYVEKEFAKLLGLIEDYFEEGGTLQRLFSPQNDKGPLGILQREIRTQFQGIRDLLVKQEEREEVWEVTTLKGTDFEDACEHILDGIVSDWLGEELERTTNVEGAVKGSRSGDFVMTLHDPRDRIAIEVKDWKSVTLPKVKGELEKAMANRQAKYGIFVSKYRESLPDKVGWFNEYGKNMLVCALGSREADTMFPGMLWVACQWARLRLLEVRGRVEKFDAAKVSQHLHDMNAHLETLKGISAECDTADRALRAIREIAQDAERAVRGKLKDVSLELGLGS